MMNLIVYSNEQTVPTSVRPQGGCLAFSKTTILDAQPICQIKHHKEAFQRNDGGKLSLCVSAQSLLGRDAPP